MMPYSISKYDPVSDDPDSGFAWYDVATVDRPMQLRPYIRELRAQTYSEVSISIVGHTGESDPRSRTRAERR